MENNITLNIHCETDSEFSKSLISALSICNGEVNRIQEALEKEQSEHGKTQEALEKEQSEHGKTQEALKKEKSEHGKTQEALEKEQSEHGKTQEALKKEQSEHGKTQEALEKEQSEHGKTQEALKKEKSEHGKTQEALEKEQSEHDKTQEALEEVQSELRTYTSNLFDVITKQFDEISALLNENINSYNNDKLQQYVLSIINQNKGGWRECNSIDDLLHNLKVGSGAICRVVNLIWWSKQESLQYMMSMVNHIDEIESKMKIVDGLLKVAGHTIKYPTNVLSKDIPNYMSYDDEKSNFIDIFSSENYDNGILCEIRLLSIDDSEGKMYEYYK